MVYEIMFDFFKFICRRAVYLPTRTGLLVAFWEFA